MSINGHLAPRANSTVVIDVSHLGQLFEALGRRGYRVIGPTVRDGAIVYDTLESPSDLPEGWTNEQEAGVYRLKPRQDDALFGYTVGPYSWKKFLYPPVIRLWKARRTDTHFKVIDEPQEPEKLALIGVRSCELSAIAIQDRVLIDGPYTEPTYKSRRENIFIVAVNCGQAGGTCFCASMGTGPKVTSSYDLVMTEVLEAEGKRHYFVVEAGTDAGIAVLSEVESKPAAAEEKAEAERIVERTAEHMGRTLNTKGIVELFQRNYENPYWDQVANRCLTCANCTMVCPTCFCMTVEDTTDLGGEQAERWRKWDSCFTTDFSYIHGGSVRTTPKSRYRQWITHKLSTWADQFGTLGCVGCGRCITWCPAAIDITEEAAAIREKDVAAPAARESEKEYANV